MPTSLISTGVQFPDNSIQTTAVTGSGGDYIMLAYASPATWSKPAGLKAVKVTVVGAGGNGANGGGPSTVGAGGGGGGAAIRYIDAPAIPGPIAVVAGPGTNSFSTFASATAGSAASGITAGAGGTGSSGTVNISGQRGSATFNSPPTIGIYGGNGGSSILGMGGMGANPSGLAAAAGTGYGGGGGGGNPNNPGAGSGSPGVVIVEEFY